MDAATRILVRDRAGNRCEYCHIPQSALETTLQVDHVIAQQHQTVVTNDSSSLAMACDRCNLHKGTNLTSVDPYTQEIVLLFHPRQDQWDEHFALIGPEIHGLTPSGRATVRLLQMNSEHRLELRHWLLQSGSFPLR